MSVHQRLILFSASLLCFGWAGSDLAFYLGRRCPGSAILVRVVCGALSALAVMTYHGAVEMTAASRRR
jgi:hypothetical protein